MEIQDCERMVEDIAWPRLLLNDYNVGVEMPGSRDSAY